MKVNNVKAQNTLRYVLLVFTALFGIALVYSGIVFTLNSTHSLPETNAWYRASEVAWVIVSLYIVLNGLNLLGWSSYRIFV